MKLTLDQASPVPLFHQIAEAIRYRLATGRLQPGDALPTLRQAAERWGVNLHTVRRAYGELIQQGLVESRGSQGTRVVGALGGRTRGAVQEFVRETLETARRRFQLSPSELAQLLLGGSALPIAAPLVHVLECSQAQCLDHARQISLQWRVDARPWCLDQADDELPAGPLLATYFHYNEIRRRWPSRLQEIRFLAIHPDPQLVRDLTAAQPKSGRKRQRLLLGEFEESMAKNMIADLSQLLPADQYALEPRVFADASEFVAQSRGRAPLLLPPRVWDQLQANDRERAHVFPVRYVIADEELTALGQEFEWQPAGPGSVRHAS